MSNAQMATKISLDDPTTWGPAMAACTEKERRFAYAMATAAGDSAAECARLAGYKNTPDKQGGIARHRAYELSHREHVKAAIRECAGVELQMLAGLALRTMREVLLDKKNPDRAKVAGTILSRIGFGESANVNLTGAIAVVDHERSAVEDLRQAIALGFPDAKLLEMFGFSGLDRYRRRMAEEDGNAPKLIEATAVELPRGAVAPPKP